MLKTSTYYLRILEYYMKENDKKVNLHTNETINTFFSASLVC